MLILTSTAVPSGAVLIFVDGLGVGLLHSSGLRPYPTLGSR
jgi:hypothetical protein